jgi:hypothetical protein
MKHRLPVASVGRWSSRRLPRTLSPSQAPLAEGAYETTVFFIRSQGFVQPTAARRISFEDPLVFERLHAVSRLIGIGAEATVRSG